MRVSGNTLRRLFQCFETDICCVVVPDIIGHERKRSRQSDQNHEKGAQEFFHYACQNLSCNHSQGKYSELILPQLEPEKTIQGSLIWDHAPFTRMGSP